jgi:hypothetical protein
LSPSANHSSFEETSAVGPWQRPANHEPGIVPPSFQSSIKAPPY